MRKLLFLILFLSPVTSWATNSAAYTNAKEQLDILFEQAKVALKKTSCNPRTEKYDPDSKQCLPKTAEDIKQEKQECLEQMLIKKWTADGKCIDKTQEEQEEAKKMFTDAVKKCPKDKPFGRITPRGFECYNDEDDSEE